MSEATAVLALELLVQRRRAALCGDPARVADLDARLEALAERERLRRLGHSLPTRWEHLTRAPVGEGETLHGGVGPITGGTS